jgi:hypothetical protein
MGKIGNGLQNKIIIEKTIDSMKEKVLGDEKTLIETTSKAEI